MSVSDMVHENGGGNQSFEVAASMRGTMICSLRGGKHFFLGGVFDCRSAPAK